MIAIQNGKNELKELIRTTGHTMIESAEETQQKRIIGTISQRLQDAMNVLDSVEACTAGGGGNPKKKVSEILLHPAVSLLLGMCALTFGVLTIVTGNTAGNPWTVWLILPLVLLLAQAVYGLIRGQEMKAAQEKDTAMAGIDLLQAKVTVTKLAGTMLGDSKAIADMFTEEKRRAGNDFENEVIKLYCNLYEAQIDNPETEDLNYVVTLTEMLLRKMGIRKVIYTPEQANLFNIQDEDYHDEMRTPALIREKTGELVRKGEYIRNISKL